jgi:hypothetical protein
MVYSEAATGQPLYDCQFDPDADAVLPYLHVAALFGQFEAVKALLSSWIWVRASDPNLPGATVMTLFFILFATAGNQARFLQVCYNWA